MFKLSKDDIKQSFKAIKKVIAKKIKYAEYDDAMHLIDVCADLGGQFNLWYEDDFLENALCTISNSTLQTISSPCISDSDRWILYDDFCLTYVLGMQWIRAMALSGKEILYITTRDINKHTRDKTIIDYVSTFPNVIIKVIPQDNRFDRAQYIYDTIVSFNASKLILHKYINSPIQLALCLLPKSINRYIINLSDQTFWLGKKSIDYVLEFRPFGASVSLQRRGFNKSQLLMVPFYPANDNNTFQGFPEECTEDKIVIFSGGDYYKTLDDNYTYWHLVNSLLKTFPNVIFLYATKNIPEGDKYIYDFIKKNNLEHRFIYIGFRPDIYQVMSHCDIYMGTNPTSGSLMTQLAAINSKPILQYYDKGTPDDETEQAICINKKFSISFNDINQFMIEAKKLISDVSYRELKGKQLKDSMIQPEQFNKLVLDTLQSNISQLPLSDYNIDFSSLDDRWFFQEKAGYINCISYIYGTLGPIYCLKFAPIIFLKKNINRFMKKIKNIFR